MVDVEHVDFDVLEIRLRSDAEDHCFVDRLAFRHWERRDPGGIKDSRGRVVRGILDFAYRDTLLVEYPGNIDHVDLIEFLRSEERRVGKEWRSRWSRDR